MASISKYAAILLLFAVQSGWTQDVPLHERHGYIPIHEPSKDLSPSPTNNIHPQHIIAPRQFQAESSFPPFAPSTVTPPPLITPPQPAVSSVVGRPVSSPPPFLNSAISSPPPPPPQTITAPSLIPGAPTTRSFVTGPGSAFSGTPGLGSASSGSPSGSNSLATAATTTSSSSGSGTAPPANTGAPDPSSPSGGLSTGAKAGIGVGAAIGGIIVLVLVFLLGKRSRRKPDDAVRRDQEAGIPEKPELSGDGAVVMASKHEIDGRNVERNVEQPQELPGDYNHRGAHVKKNQEAIFAEPVELDGGRNIDRPPR